MALPDYTGTRSRALAAPTQAQVPENHTVAFTVASWPCDGVLRIASISAQKQSVVWIIQSFLRECWSAREEYGESLRKLKSWDFFVAHTVAFNFFVSFDIKETRSQFGIVRTRIYTDAAFDCYFDISFQDTHKRQIKYIGFNVKWGSAASHWEKKDFLSDSELREFLRSGESIHCRIRIKERKEDDGISMARVDIKLCQDFNNLLLSEEGSDVILQVRDHQFKAHRSILTARSSIFASMFRLDMKEKETGVVDVEDCEPSSFPVLLEFMYCGCTEKLSAENVFDLYASADKYDVQGLKMKCLQFIMNNLSMDTFFETLQLSLLHSEKDLLNLATEFFIRNFHQIILTPEWLTFLSKKPVQGNELIIKATKNMSLSPLWYS